MNFIALNKLEKVALSLCKKRGKPLVLILNNVHHFKNDADGRAMLLQLQQRAEAWAASGMFSFLVCPSIHLIDPIFERHIDSYLQFVSFLKS